MALIAMLLLLAPVVVVKPAATTSDRDGNPGIQVMSANSTGGERQAW
jgi:hypothetical protein